MAYATVEDVTKRLEEEPTERMIAMIEEYLEDATDAAKYASGMSWSDLTVPKAVGRIVASAVARFMRNPDLYQQSRAGDETVAWQDMTIEDWFTDQEINRLKGYALARNLKGFGTFGVTAGTTGHWRRTDQVVYVPSADGTRPFPFLDAGDPIIGRYA